VAYDVLQAWAIASREEDHIGLQVGAVRQNNLVFREVVDLGNDLGAAAALIAAKACVDGDGHAGPCECAIWAMRRQWQAEDAQVFGERSAGATGRSGAHP
jgi:hypothetical protein